MHRCRLNAYGTELDIDLIHQATALPFDGDVATAGCWITDPAPHPSASALDDAWSAVAADLFTFLIHHRDAVTRLGRTPGVRALAIEIHGPVPDLACLPADLVGLAAEFGLGVCISPQTPGDSAFPRRR